MSAQGYVTNLWGEDQPGYNYRVAGAEMPQLQLTTTGENSE